MHILRKLLKNEKGATAIEYGLIAALIAVAAITATKGVGTAVSGKMDTVSTCMNDAKAC